MAIALGALVVVLALLIFARPLRAAPDDTAALRRAGALLWEMSEKRQEFSDRHTARGVTPEKARRMAESTSALLARNRDALAVLLPRLTPDSRFAKDLTRFLTKWPNRAAFLDDLLIPNRGGVSGSDIASLAMQVPDTRRGWKTLFPFFRP